MQPKTISSASFSWVQACAWAPSFVYSSRASSTISSAKKKRPVKTPITLSFTTDPCIDFESNIDFYFGRELYFDCLVSPWFPPRFSIPRKIISKPIITDARFCTKKTKWIAVFNSFEMAAYWWWNSSLSLFFCINWARFIDDRLLWIRQLIGVMTNFVVNNAKWFIDLWYGDNEVCNVMACVTGWQRDDHIYSIKSETNTRVY